VVAHLNG